MAGDRPCRMVAEGQGGNFRFDQRNLKELSSRQERPEQIDLIGMYWCHYCVGVYFRVDANQCFCAHINVYTLTVEIFSGLTVTEGEDIEQQIIDKMMNELHSNDWNPERAEFGDNLVVVCPEYERYADPEPLGIDGFALERTSWYAVRAVREFFRRTAKPMLEEARIKAQVAEFASAHMARQARDREVHLQQRADTLLRLADFEVDKQSQGFIVEHSIGRVQKITHVEEEVASRTIPAALHPYALFEA